MHLHAHPRSELHQALARDHERLERHFRILLGGPEPVDPDQVREAWERLDRELRGHMRTEEERLLPLYEVKATVEAAKLRAEHHQLRRQLDQLGSDLSLRQLQRARAEEFILLLHEHALREERTLYPWADESMSRRAKAAVLDRLHALSGRAGSFSSMP